MTFRLPLALVLLALAAGCDGNSSEPRNTAASGEVLEGTISDEMLPYSELRSHPPLADPDGSGTAESPVATGGGAAPAEEPEAEESETAAEAGE